MGVRVAPDSPLLIIRRFESNSQFILTEIKRNMKENTATNNSTLRVNRQIKLPQVKVVAADGKYLGVISTYDALRMAQEQGLDLVEVNPNDRPSLCKIIDFGKYKYELKKKLAEERKNQKIVETKEISFRPKTDDNDLQHKLKSAKSFLEEGNKVRLSCKFRGREITHTAFGEDKIKFFLEQLKDVMSNSTPLTFEGKVMSLTINPK
jgi:translation initiation factor IF-3